MRRRRLSTLAVALVALLLAVSACDGENETAPSPFVDESGAPLFDEAVDPGEQDTTGDDDGAGGAGDEGEPGDGTEP